MADLLRSALDRQTADTLKRLQIAFHGKLTSLPSQVIERKASSEKPEQSTNVNVELVLVAAWHVVAD
jgi:hypothetical protein